jgi:raffinose/stachyose/melibiose transport system substrate-binding protein
MKKGLACILAMLFVFLSLGMAVNAEEVRTIRYFTSKAPTDDVVTTIQEIAQKYFDEGGKVKLVVETAADRSAYDQKLRTLAAGDQLPDMFETDATDFCKQMADNGMLVDMEAFLKKIGMYDSYIQLAINYQRLPDGRVFMIPLEFVTEMIWYNVDLFKACNLSAPKTFDEWLNVCRVLQANGYTPISIDGIDGWPLMRYIAQTPFRRAGNDYLYQLASGKAKLSDPIGIETVNFIASIGKYFQTGFASTDYSTARNIFLDGKAAMYEIGTWELNNFLAKNLPAGLNVDYFYMPMTDNAVTTANEYWAFGGIGLACSSKNFDQTMEDFLAYLIDHYDAAYLAKQHFPPRAIGNVDLSQFDPLFLRIKDDMALFGGIACFPWDVALAADVVLTLNDNLPALAMGKLSPEDFIQIIDKSLAENVK